MNKNILVTGCSRGVGLEICRVLLREGNIVYGVARSHTDEFKDLEREYAGHLFFKSIDLADSEGTRKSIFKEFITNDIVLHGFVNNAAVAYDDIVTNLNLGRLKAMYDVNVFTPMVITKYAIRNMMVMGIRSNCVVPGFMATSMSSSLTDEQRSKIYARTSLKAATSINSVAEMVAFLLSEKADSVTAQNIHVDNGTI